MIELLLDKRSPVPFYRQIVDLVLVGISGGAVQPGDRLPTIRELAVKLEVNPNTVVKAYTQLQLLGVLDTQQGSGVFVSKRAETEVPAADRRRAIEGLCRDFVGRAQLLDINIHELIEQLQHMQHPNVEQRK
jgi:GntR family transcriptional regulator